MELEKLDAKLFGPGSEIDLLGGREKGEGNHHAYRHYGGRGIRLHESWRDNFAAFAMYILNTIEERAEGMTLDRINNDGDYAPHNLRWATWSEQCLNQRRSTLKAVA